MSLRFELSIDDLIFDQHLKKVKRWKWALIDLPLSYQVSMSDVRSMAGAVYGHCALAQETLHLSKAISVGQVTDISEAVQRPGVHTNQLVKLQAVSNGVGSPYYVLPRLSRI